MSNNLSRGPFQVITGHVIELNDTFRRIRQELDEIQGLNGRALIYDRVAVGVATASDDAAQLSTVPTNVMTLGTAQTVTAQKTWDAAAVRYIDSNGTLLHAFGAST